MHLAGFIIRIYHDARSPERLVGFIIRIYHDARSPERLVGFIIRIYHDARSPERQKQMWLSAGKLHAFVLS